MLTWAIVPARASTPSRRAWKRLRSPALLPSAGGGPLCGGVGLLRAPPPQLRHCGRLLSLAKDF